MPKTRAELDGMLDELQRDLTMLILDQVDHEDLWVVFAGQADHISAVAAPEDQEHVRTRIDAILRAHGIDPQQPAASSPAS